MKKRIGTKLYDTDKAVPVLPDRGLYKQGNRQTYFIFDGETITPIDFWEAEAFLEDAGIIEVTRHSQDLKGRAKIAVSPDAADRLAAFCRVHGVTQKKVIEDFIYSLEI